MKAETANYYPFKYLECCTKSEGLKGVYLPLPPTDDKILFRKENKFTRPAMPDNLVKAVKEWKRRQEVDPKWVSPKVEEIARWEETEWQRTTDGVWFFNGGERTYITRFYYFYLTAWETYFGNPIFRDTDKEITYALEYVEEDADCFGMLLNTIRRYGKSSIMAAWAVFRLIRNYHHYAGIQAEKDTKAAEFYNQMIVKPFHKLPYYFQPTYDTSSTQKQELRLERAPKRGKATVLAMFDDQTPVLESVLDYRPSGEGEYDGAVLHTYLAEEVGKTLAADVNVRWKVVKPCLRKGRAIRGKAFMGTTVEWMDAASKGGKAYRRLFVDSDFGDRGPDGRTKSGLYAFFLPGDCALEDFLDEFGRPMRDKARQAIMDEREAVKDNPKDHSDLIRKYPLHTTEIFYISSEKCVFNAKVIQDRIADINRMIVPIVSRGSFAWENNVRFSRVIFQHNPITGWAKIASLPDPDQTNKVTIKESMGGVKYLPAGDDKHRAGVDPIDHALVEDSGSDEESAISTRRSKPVMFIKRMYDTAIDGPLTTDLMIQRAQEKYPYKTGKRIVMMDVRPNDPHVFYERALMMCWYFGCSIQVENQKPGLMNWFHENNCEAFLQQKYVAVSDVKGQKQAFMSGTPASTTAINEYTDALAVDIEYFGHVEPFIELLSDLLVFNPKKTQVHDYSVAAGWTELACKARTKSKPREMIDLNDYLPVFDSFGNVVN